MFSEICLFRGFKFLVVEKVQGNFVDLGYSFVNAMWL